MEEILKNNIFIISIIIINIILCLINYIRLSKTKKEYIKFMKKIGNGNNLDEMIKSYVKKVEKVNEENKELKENSNRLAKEKEKCIQKVGIVRYSAYKDVGSDLSFTLALLDNNNNGVVLNGIYAADSSNIYAKPIQNGTSTYTITSEERQAIEQAIK